MLDPQVPPGLVQVILQAHTALGVQGGTPVVGLTKVRDASEYLRPEELPADEAEAPALVQP